MNFELVYVFLTGLVITLVLGKVAVPLLGKLKAKQSIREEGPKSHQAKSGTPTMGGLFLLLGLIITVLIFSPRSLTVWSLLFLTVGHGLLGFIDDFIKAVKKRNLGITAKQKLFGQFIMSILFSLIGIEYLALPTTVWIPFTSITFDMGIWYYGLVLAIIVATSNAVNLTDGLDGLAAGTSFIGAIAYAIIGLWVGSQGVSYFAVALGAACLSFLYFNSNPAKVFMGDTGSLAIGGAFAGMAIMTKTELLFIIVGGVFVIEALSVVIQVISFKTRGVRVFKMSPIHHHFELSGWNEKKVVTRFWIAGIICSIVGLITIALS